MFQTYKYSTGIKIQECVSKKDIIISKRKLRCKNNILTNKNFIIKSNDKNLLKYDDIEMLDLSKDFLPFDIKEENKIKSITIVYYMHCEVIKDYICFITTTE